MTFDDTTLMAYADGELDEAARRQLELALQADPALAARVRQHMAVRQNVQRAYAGVLEAAVPARLREALAGPGASSGSNASNASNSNSNGGNGGNGSNVSNGSNGGTGGNGGNGVNSGASGGTSDASGDNGGSEAGRSPLRCKVIQLDSVRAARRLPAGAAAPGRRQWSQWRQSNDGVEGYDGHPGYGGRHAHGGHARRMPPWATLVTALLFGLIAGSAAVTAYHGETTFATVNGQGMLRAHGKLDTALNVQLGSGVQPRGNLRMGVSFVGRDGQYCRAFELGTASSLACRAGAGWNLVVLVEGPGRQNGGMAAPVLAAIDARALGPALDAAAERAAAARGWSR